MNFLRYLLLPALLLLRFVSSATELPSVADILKYTNEYRAKMGKAPLVYDEAAGRQATQHTRRMASGATPMGHEGFPECVAALREDKRFIYGAAENVAYGYLSARAVVDGWIKSTTHRKNMLGDYNQIGIGVAEGKDGRIYFTQLFIKR